MGRRARHEEQPSGRCECLNGNMYEIEIARLANGRQFEDMLDGDIIDCFQEAIGGG